MKIIADECVDYNIIVELKKGGFEIVTVIHEFKSFSDETILEISTQPPAILITEDKDFGELIFHRRLPFHSLILLRYPLKTDRYKIASFLISLLTNYNDILQDSFIVITPNKIRSRKF